MKLGVMGLFALVLSIGACEPETVGGEREGVACDPLEVAHVAVELGYWVGGGIDAAGTLYVVDEVDGELRLFVSDGDELVLRHESGTGSSTDELGTLYSFSFAPGEALNVALWRGNDGSVRMGVLEGALPPGAKQLEIGELGEELEIVGDEAMAGLSVRSDEASMVAEYAGALAGTKWLVVVRPERGSYEEFRVFFGPIEQLEERAVANVSRARDGGSTIVEFSVGGDTAIADFPVVSLEDDEGFARGEASLTLLGEAEPLELLPEGDSPASATYFCH